MSHNDREIVRRLLKTPTDAEVKRTVDVLVAAFRHAQFMQILVGGDMSLLPVYYGASVRSAIVGGHVVVSGSSPEDITGAAVWYAPGQESFGTDEQRAGLINFMQIMPDSLREWWTKYLNPSYTAFTDELLGAEYKKSAWYLQLMGVEPELQGHGFGSALLSYGDDLARKTGSPIILETTNEKAVSFYKHFGFAVRGETIINSTMGDTKAYVLTKETK